MAQYSVPQEQMNFISACLGLEFMTLKHVIAEILDDKNIISKNEFLEKYDKYIKDNTETLFDELMKLPEKFEPKD